MDQVINIFHDKAHAAEKLQGYLLKNDQFY